MDASGINSLQSKVPLLRGFPHLNTLTRLRQVLFTTLHHLKLSWWCLSESSSADLSLLCSDLDGWHQTLVRNKQRKGHITVVPPKAWFAQGCPFTVLLHHKILTYATKKWGTACTLHKIWHLTLLSNDAVHVQRANITNTNQESQSFWIFTLSLPSFWA